MPGAVLNTSIAESNPIKIKLGMGVGGRGGGCKAQCITLLDINENKTIASSFFSVSGCLLFSNNSQKASMICTCTLVDIFLKNIFNRLPWELASFGEQTWLLTLKTIPTLYKSGLRFILPKTTPQGCKKYNINTFRKFLTKMATLFSFFPFFSFLFIFFFGGGSKRLRPMTTFCIQHVIQNPPEKLKCTRSLHQSIKARGKPANRKGASSYVIILHRNDPRLSYKDHYSNRMPVIN